MSLKDILELLYQVALKENINNVCFVGGAPRDKAIGNLANTFSDLDITTGSKDIFTLAKLFSIQLQKHIAINTKQSADGHISIFTNTLKLDFSSNFNIPNIDQILSKMGISNPTDMQREIYSRDFFCNTLLMSLDFRKIKDPTGEGINDIKNKVIRTCLSPDLTFKYNIKRIIRVVYLASKLDFDVDSSIIEWVKNNPRYLIENEKEYLSKNINKALEYDADRAAFLINKMHMWKYIPITRELEPYFRKYSILGAS